MRPATARLPVPPTRWLTRIALLLTLLATGCDDHAASAPSISRDGTQPSFKEHTVAGQHLRAPLSPPDRHTDQNQAPADDIFFAPGSRSLIIHADDAGMCRSVNRGTIEALEAGLVTSTSIMVPCPAFEEFARFARNHPEYDYGVHLTLNAEFEWYRWGPVLPRDEVPSLVDPDGRLWETPQQIAGNARPDDVDRELRAQIDRALASGIRLTHLDSHMGTLFMRPDLLDIYVRLGLDYNLPILVPQNNAFLRQLGADQTVISQLEDSIVTLQQQKLPIIDTVLMHYVRDSVSSKKRAYLNMIRSAPVGVTEIIVHCGVSDSELRSITYSHRVRDGDRRIFTDPSVITELANSDVNLITWKQFHQMASEQVD